ncbi:MAG: YbgA family protein [Nitrosopumilus sp.]|uniref:YbgA family protein n=1 Tax=Nitrosopumilus sp. TaxID=2024843 RepID=UPI002469CF7E|nr:YbgA family protein [Nitrosopumilus sp.]MDH5431997.1 YbgA family protein [Nitrosopumilus sp.]
MSENFTRADVDKIIVSEKDAIKFVLDRFSVVKNSKKIRDLVDFQAMNKYMLMAHNQEELKLLGNIVASHKKIPLHDILDKYEEHLKIALKKEPTIKTHLNVMMHIFGYFSKYFSQSEKDLYYELLRQFKEEQITVGKMLSEIGPLIYRFNNTYLARQTYFLLYADTRPGILFAVLNNKN